jgi:RNA polymerase sigma factor (sigma-70 family)
MEDEIDLEEPDFTDNLYETDDFLRIIKQLPPGYSLILNLYFLEEMTHKEIANQLEITVGTSKSQLFKAKKRLKKILIKTLSNEEIKLYEGFTQKVV